MKSKKSLLFAWVAVILVISSSLQVFATGKIDVTDLAGVTTISSTFTMTDGSDLGYVVSIPADLNLVYDSSTNEFRGSGVFYPKGVIASDKELLLGVEPATTWENTTYGISVEGLTSIDGISAKDVTINGTSYKLSYVVYTPEQVALGDTSPVTHTINVSVSRAKVPYNATYTGQVLFYVDLI